MNQTVIVGLARTPIGNLLGELKDFSAPQLGTHAIKHAIQQTKLTANDVEEVLLGCVLPAGIGQAPARQAALAADIPVTTPCTTLNKVCGSGMKTIMLAHNLLQVHERKIIIAGGMESMTNAPYLLLKGRQGYRLGKNEIYDHMMLDGLEDAYERHPMGHFAEMCVQKYQFSRQEQDEFAIRSLERARKASEDGAFSFEIVPLKLTSKNGDAVINKDEKPYSVKPEKIPQLRAVFQQDGTVTAGNSSSIADGAAALLLMQEQEALARDITPLARIVGTASIAKHPAEFTTAPIDATRQLLKKLSWQAKDVDLFEVNEAFAVVALAFMRDLNLSPDKVNIHGGAVALGHPIGASGARIVVTLIAALRNKKMKRGIATACIGGGEATAIAIEMY